MHSKQRRKANRNFIHGAKKEIREVLGQALMSGGRVKPPVCPARSDFLSTAEYHRAMGDWSVYSNTHFRMFKKCLSAGLIDEIGAVTPKGLEVLKND